MTRLALILLLGQSSWLLAEESTNSPISWSGPITAESLQFGDNGDQSDGQRRLEIDLSVSNSSQPLLNWKTSDLIPEPGYADIAFKRMGDLLFHNYHFGIYGPSDKQLKKDYRLVKTYNLAVFSRSK